jgi:phage terminase small subunit
MRSFNAAKAYQMAYGCSYDTAKVEASKHLTKPNIQAEINKLKQEMSMDLYLDARAVFQAYINIAFADIKDFLSFGTRDVKQGSQLVKTNYVEVKNSEDVDGQLIQEIKLTKEGITIKLHDKMKALEQLAKYLDLFPDQHQRRIEQEQLELAKKKLELDKRITKLREDELKKGSW